MRIISEKTHKTYNTPEECIADEEAFDKEQAKIKEQQIEIANAKREKAKAVEEAYAAAVKSQQEFLKLRNEFIEEYGYFHMTYRNKVDFPSINNMLGAFIEHFML